MKPTEFYSQCILEKKLPNSRLEQVAYIPAKFAVVNKVLRLKEKDTWDDGWVVKSIGPLEPAEKVEHDSRNYLRIRQAIDMMRGER